MDKKWSIMDCSGGKWG